ncbi:MAG: hypothetical protein U1F40_05400 [Turneriella sp.]
MRKLITWPVAIMMVLNIGQLPIFAAVQTLTGNGLTLTYNDTNCGAGVSASDCNTIMRTAFDKTAGQFQLPGLKDYLSYMSTAQSVTTKGHGVDYTTNPSLFVVGVSGGMGIEVGEKSLSEAAQSYKNSGSVPAFGTAFQFSAMGGINLGAIKSLPAFGPVDLKRLTVYAHAGALDITSLVSVDGLNIRSNQFGLHGKYKVIESKSLGFGTLNWGGFDLISGLTVANNTIKYQKNFDAQTSGSGTISDPAISIAPTGSITTSNSAVAIPFEVATSVRVLYVLSLFGGTGIDLNFGRSSVEMDVRSLSVTSTVAGTTTNLTDASIKLNASESSGGRFGDVRFFGGMAINLIPLRNTNMLSLVIQGNVTAGGSYSTMMGVRAGW